MPLSLCDQAAMATGLYVSSFSWRVNTNGYTPAKFEEKIKNMFLKATQSKLSTSRHFGKFDTQTLKWD